MFGLTDRDREIIIEVLRRYPDVTEAIIYGSRAMGNYKPRSDIDLALKGHLNKDTALNISAELNERSSLPYQFDVIAYSDITLKSLIEHIDLHGKSFYCKK